MVIHFKRSEMKVAQSCPTLCDPVDCSLLGSSVPGIFQARILEWIAIPFSKGSSQPRDQTQASCTAGGFYTTWAILHAARIVDTCRPQSPSPLTPVSPPWCPCICSLHLCLYFCFADVFVCTICLDSGFHIYVLIDGICFPLSVFLYSAW